MQYRAKNDIYNSIYAGFISGAVLGRNSGPRAMALGGEWPESRSNNVRTESNTLPVRMQGFGFAAFSGLIDTYLRWESPDEDVSDEAADGQPA